MYLAFNRYAATTSYEIRQSYRDAATGRLRHRPIFELGPRPADYLEIMADIAVFFDSELENVIRNHTEQDPSSILEKLLWPFLPRPTREHLSRFHHTERYIPAPFSNEEQGKIDEQIHIFDRRRLYYLHYRAVDQSRLFTLRPRAFRPLLDTCRDEREYYFAEREEALEPGEYYKYIYAIFNLQRFFSQSSVTFRPELLPKTEVANHFTSAICELQESISFWAGESVSPNLHPHLVRYLLMFFDFAPTRLNFAEEEYVRRFMNSHRTFRWPERKPPVSEERIREIFGRPQTELKQLSRKELTRLYRKMAKKLHPDRGGDQASFVALTEVYTALLHGK
jgi:hypothetical protein